MNQVAKIPTRELTGVSYVHSDEKQGMELAAGHLAERGCRNIGALLHGAPGLGNVDLRREYFLRALKERKLAADEAAVRICPTENFFEEMGKLLRLGIDGVFCGGGGNFGGIAAYCLSLYGKNIPQDIRLVSSERQRISRYCIPPQTTISQDYDAIAATAIRRLDGMIRGTMPAARTVLPYHLLVRDNS